MDKKLYVTVVHETKRQYILGRISGMIRALSDGRSCYSSELITKEKLGIGNFYISKAESYLMKVDATSEEYSRMKAVIERDYPGLCDFDVTHNDG